MTDRAIGRRRLLGGGAAVAVAAALPAVAAAGRPRVRAPLAFDGEHQAGITAPPARAGVVAALDVRADGQDGLRELLGTMSAEIDHVMSGAPFESRGGGFPPSDTGVLGPEPGPHGLSVVLGVGASLFDDRFGLRARRAYALTPMERFANDAMVTPERSDGDLSLVVQADTPDAAMHAVRQVLRRTRGVLSVRWLREGYNVVDQGVGRGEAPSRNLMGFKDGTVNPDVTDGDAMADHVWIGPDDDQPDWAIGGSFQAIRVIRMMVEFWDRTRLNEQEAIFGRHRDSGAPLGRSHETDEPGEAFDLASHIGRANPRRPESPVAPILRRPFSYLGGVDGNDQLDQGLLFVCYQRDIRTGFVAMQRRLEGEALEEYIRPLGGGFFIALPGPAGGPHLGWQLLDG